MDSEARSSLSSSSEGEEDEETGYQHHLPLDLMKVKRCTGSRMNLPPSVNGKKIPLLLWWVIKLSSVLHHRNLVVERRCFNCTIKKRIDQLVVPKGRRAFLKVMWTTSIDMSGQNYDIPDTYPTIGSARYEDHSEAGTCEICNSFWWNHEGVPEVYKDNDIGAGPWNGRGSWILSVIMTCGAICVVLYDIVYYLQSLWGRQNQIIHVLSYTTYMMSLIFYPILNLISKLRSSGTQNLHGATWSTTLNARFLVKRLQFMDFKSSGIPGRIFLLLVYVCTLYLIGLRASIYIDICGGFSWHSGISVFCGGFIILMCGHFQYLMYLTRLSFGRQFYLLVNYVELHQHDLDACRKILGVAMRDFICFRKLTEVYMFLFIPTSIWSITTTVTWMYFLQYDKNTDKDYWHFQLFVGILKWSENVIFLALSLWAFGGVNTTHIWRRFQLSVLTICRRGNTGRRKFLRKIMRHIMDFNEDAEGINLTMVMSVVSFFMALGLGDRQWTVFVIKEPSCNDTFITPLHH